MAAFVAAPLVSSFVSTSVTNATSFAPRLQLKAAAASKNASNLVMMAKSKSMPFMDAPDALDGSMVGDVGFDPLGFSRIFDIKFLREAELKHCRIAMLACLGFFVQEIFTFPGVPKMLATSAHDKFVTIGSLQQISVWVHFLELFGLLAVLETMKGDRAPGDFSFDPLGLGKNPETMKKYQLSELKNGRLAMIGIGGLIHGEWVTKTGGIDALFHLKPIA